MREFGKFLIGVLIGASLFANSLFIYKMLYASPSQEDAAQEAKAPPITEQSPVQSPIQTPVQTAPQEQPEPQSYDATLMNAYRTDQNPYKINADSTLNQEPVYSAPPETKITQYVSKEAMQAVQNGGFSFGEDGLHYECLYYGEPITGQTGNVAYEVFPVIASAWYESPEYIEIYGHPTNTRFSVIIMSITATNMSETEVDYLFSESSIVLDNDSMRIEVNRDISDYPSHLATMPLEKVESSLTYIPRTDWTNNKTLDFFLRKADSDSDYSNGNFIPLTFTLRDISELYG